MKLNIIGLYKMIGQTVGKGWLVSDVSETDGYYCFLCRKVDTGGHLTNVRLRRDGVFDHNDGSWGFHFWWPYDGQPTSFVTPDWFADMDNAKQAILMELET
jgi:hypothetical protein